MKNNRYSISIRHALMLLVLLLGFPSLGYAVFHDEVVYRDVRYKLDLGSREATVVGFANKHAKIKDVVIPSRVPYATSSILVVCIGDYAFSDCTSLTSIRIGTKGIEIGSGAFYKCTSLTKVDIPYAGVIGNYAFYGCSGLTTIPKIATSIGDGAFGSCSGLTSVTIPEGVTSIGANAFQYCRGLTSITIPNSVTTIGGGAFYKCSGLTSVTIPEGVTSIGNKAFVDCNSLESLTIPNSVTTIGDGAFFSTVILWYPLPFQIDLLIVVF